MSEKIEFAHVRMRNPDGNVTNHRGSTFAFKEVGDGQIVYAAAHCGPNDNFNKKLGRAKAAGRLNSDRYKSTFFGTRSEFLSAIYE